MIIIIIIIMIIMIMMTIIIIITNITCRITVIIIIRYNCESTILCSIYVSVPIRSTPSLRNSGSTVSSYC